MNPFSTGFSNTNLTSVTYSFSANSNVLLSNSISEFSFVLHVLIVFQFELLFVIYCTLYVLSLLNVPVVILFALTSDGRISPQIKLVTVSFDLFWISKLYVISFPGSVSTVPVFSTSTIKFTTSFSISNTTVCPFCVISKSNLLFSGNI